MTDKAVRRAYLPKPAFLLLLDLLSLIPFTRMMMLEECETYAIWPNIMMFSEFLIIYRVLEYFQLLVTHSPMKLVVGFTFLFTICVNCISSFWILLTKTELCSNCRIYHKLDETAEEYTTYIYGIYFFICFALQTHTNEFKPSTIAEFITICLFIAIGYILAHFIVTPKLFAESLLRLSRICNQYPTVKKVLEETKRRNPRCSANVQDFYNIMWSKRSGVINTPLFFKKDIPRYLRLEVQQDLLWQVFYHSSTLRNTSTSFQRWLSDKVFLRHKLPNEQFYISASDNMHCHYYFIKSGIVQLISADDDSTPILTVTAGTLFGDINFLVPHRTGKVVLRCLTFCEYYILPRENLLSAMHNYEDDRKLISDSVRKRIKHAKSLFNNKQKVRGVDRTEDEGILWIKRRWWEIFVLVNVWKKMTAMKCEIPREDTHYHCPKYLGQLVLCTENQLQTKSLFSRVKFPWILAPKSSFGVAWHRIVIVTVLLVLFLYPPNLIKARDDISPWFILFSCWVDFIYTIDIGVSLSTAVKKQNNVISKFGEVMLERCKSLHFILDIMAAIWLEEIFQISGLPQYYSTGKFNRLIKMYKLFCGEIQWDIKTNPIIIVIWKIILLQIAALILTSHLLYELCSYINKRPFSYFFGRNVCQKGNVSDCDPIHPILGVSIFMAFEYTFSENLPTTLNDLYISSALTYIFFVVYFYCKGHVIAFLYLKDIHEINYRHFVIKLEKFCKDYKLPQDLLKKLHKYATCHWKYYNGINVMEPRRLNEEPFEIFWKCQGQVVESIISQSKAFKGADPALIRDLACAAKLLIIPKNATIFLFGAQCKKVLWLLQGHVKSEYYDEKGQLTQKDYNPGNMLSLMCVFFEKASIRTYTSYTDCEFAFIHLRDFLIICKRYPHEWNYLQTAIKKYKPEFEDMFVKFLIVHSDNAEKQRNPNPVTFRQSIPFVDWGKPESAFMQAWFVLRVFVVCISITVSSLQGTIGVAYGWQNQFVGIFCDSIAGFDIILKFFLYYHDKRGILIKHKGKCMLNYLTKGFLLDIIGALPWVVIVETILSKDINKQDARLLNMICKFAHLYIVFSYFNYITDIPTVNVTLFLIIKWQIVNTLILLGVSHYLVARCVDIEYDSNMKLVTLTKRNECWIPVYWNMPQRLNLEHMKLIFAESLDLANSGLTRMNLGRFSIEGREGFGVGLVLAFLYVLSWFVMCFILKSLILNSRGDTLFQNDVDQLERFLTSERIDKKIIAKAMKHFKYCWMRTKGVNIHQLTTERIGAVFGQDLSYYFFRQTFDILDTILQAGESIHRYLANYSKPVYYLPGDEILREMDLSPSIYVVHRGGVIISRNGKKVTTLTKGDVFGQLTGIKLRPIKISAQAVRYVDLLEIKVKIFQEIITDEVRQIISENPHAKFDFMANKKVFIENPYDTVEYILRGKKMIKLPRATRMTAAYRGNWYSWWLFLSWICVPFLSAAVVVMLGFTPSHITVHYGILFILDLLHVANLIADFYSMELVVRNNECVYRRLGSRLLTHWLLYVDLLSILVPLLSIMTNDWRYQLTRLWRLRLFYNFDYHFCRSFKSKIASVVLKIAITLLLIHFSTCGWIYVACQYEVFPIPVPSISNSSYVEIDHGEWIHPNERGQGCARIISSFESGQLRKQISFLVPKHLSHDYIVALTYILLIFTHTNTDYVLPVSISQVYYKVIVTTIVYMIDMWLMSVTIIAVYSCYRALYIYDYLVENVRIYLKDRGLCDILLKSFSKYTKKSWGRRQGGNWLPELAVNSPPCLRQDIFCALYLHHLNMPPTFRQLPDYFKRQLAVRFERVVVDPGKCIVREGDTFNVTYFIHEGEVEKWYLAPNGENKMLSVLYTNGYFGCISGLFTHESFQFSYYSRTVVDLLILDLSAWNDLLEGYPDVKSQLYEATNKLKSDYMRNSFGKQLSSSHGPILTDA